MAIADTLTAEAGRERRAMQAARVTDEERAACRGALDKPAERLGFADLVLLVRYYRAAARLQPSAAAASMLHTAIGHLALLGGGRMKTRGLLVPSPAEAQQSRVMVLADFTPAEADAYKRARTIPAGQLTVEQARLRVRYHAAEVGRLREAEQRLARAEHDLAMAEFTQAVA